MLSAAEPVVSAFVLEAPGGHVQKVVQHLLRTVQSPQNYVERRRAQRHAYPYPLRLWLARACQISANVVQTVGGGDIVMGKHLSTGGLDFYSPEPIVDRRVVISLEAGHAQPVQMLTELTWCRFGGHGMYVNGGRFLRLLDRAQNTSPALVPQHDGCNESQHAATC